MILSSFHCGCRWPLWWSAWRKPPITSTRWRCSSTRSPPGSNTSPVPPNRLTLPLNQGRDLEPKKANQSETELGAFLKKNSHKKELEDVLRKITHNCYEVHIYLLLSYVFYNRVPFQSNYRILLETPLYNFYIFRRWRGRKFVKCGNFTLFSLRYQLLYFQFYSRSVFKWHYNFKTPLKLKTQNLNAKTLYKKYQLPVLSSQAKLKLNCCVKKMKFIKCVVF